MTNRAHAKHNAAGAETDHLHGPAGQDGRRARSSFSSLVPMFILVIAGLAVYSNNLNGVFLLDDMSLIVENPAILDSWHLETPVRSCPSRPLLPVTLAANYAWGGFDVTGYHWFNNLVHIGCALALYGTVRRTLLLPSVRGHYCIATPESATCTKERPREPIRNIVFDTPTRLGVAEWTALTIALLWVVHPLNTQAVTYIVQRCEAMMAFFFLGTIYCLVRGATAERGWAWYSAGLGSFCLGLASKEVMVTVIPVLWLYDRLFLASNWREVIRRRGWFHALLLAPVGIASLSLAPMLFAEPHHSAGFGIQSVQWYEYAWTQPSVILHYLRLAAWPDPLCFDYGWPVETRWLSGILVPGAIIALLLSGSVGLLANGWRIGFLGLTFFFVLAPTSSILPINDLCFEHRMYLPLACVISLVVIGSFELASRRWSPFVGTVAFVTVTSITLVFGALTVARNWTYQSAVGMWSDVVQKTADSCTPAHLANTLDNLGTALLVEDRPEECVALLEAALRNGKCDSTTLHANLARAFITLGRADHAAPHCAEALRRNPKCAQYHRLMAIVAVADDKFTIAEQHLRAAVSLAPKDAGMVTNLGQCLADQERYAEAATCFRQALAMDPVLEAARSRLVECETRIRVAESP